MKRFELQEQYINSVIDGMDWKTMWKALYNYMDESCSKLSDEEMIEEIKEYHPELLKEE